MPLAPINRTPSPKVLRTFGLLWCASAGVAAWRLGSHGHAPAALVSGVLGTFALVGFAWRAWMRWLFIGTCYVTYPLGFVVSHVLLFLVFFGVFAPLGLLMRACGRDPLRRTFDSTAETYWEKHNAPAPPARYFKQF